MSVEWPYFDGALTDEPACARWGTNDPNDTIASAVMIVARLLHIVPSIWVCIYLCNNLPINALQMTNHITYKMIITDPVTIPSDESRYRGCG